MGAVDLGCSDMFVPSVECSEPQSCNVHPLYNSTLSSSYQEDGRPVHVNHVFFYTRGNASRDSLHVGNIEVLEQPFEEATTVRPVYFYDDTSYDTPFGLSREVVISEDSSLQTQSPFQNMMAQGLLFHNAFSLKLPQSKDDFGTLTIGGRDDQYAQGDAAALPLIQRLREGQDEPYPSGGWQVEPISLSFDTGHERVHYDLRGHVATFSTVVPLLDLPASFSSLFKDFVGVDRDSGNIDCDKANSETLPNLEISLKGVGDTVHTFDFTPADYVRSEPRLPFMEPGICYVPIIEHEDSNVPKYISLGSLFLRKYYSMFDADALTITCRLLLLCYLQALLTMPSEQAAGCLNILRAASREGRWLEFCITNPQLMIVGPCFNLFPPSSRIFH